MNGQNNGILEVNSECPGGWGYDTTAYRCLQEAVKANPSSELCKALILAFETGEKLDTLRNMAEFIIQTKETVGAELITVLVVDGSLLSPNDEDTAMVRILNEQGIKARGLGINEYLALPREEKDLIFRDFTLQELRDYCSENMLNFEQVYQTLESQAHIVNPLATERYGSRNWPEIIGIKGNYVPKLIKSSELNLERQLSEAEKIEISKNHVLKMEGSFGGKGIFLPGEYEWEDLERAIQEERNFVLEPYLRGPIIKQPIMISPLPIKDPYYYAQVDGKVHGYTVDTRIIFGVTPEGSVSIIGGFGRFNHPDRPDNVSSGGGLTPLLIIEDEDYDKQVSSLNVALESATQQEIAGLYQDYNLRLDQTGMFNVYGKRIVGGIVPRIIRRSTLEEVKSFATECATRIKAKGSFSSFYFAFDMYINE